MVFGHIVSHDESTSHGIYYLMHELDVEEVKVFFDQAYNRGTAIFEDHMGYKFKLIHHGGEYQLVKPQI